MSYSPIDGKIYATIFFFGKSLDLGPVSNERFGNSIGLFTNLMNFTIFEKIAVF